MAPGDGAEYDLVGEPEVAIRGLGCRVGDPPGYGELILLHSGGVPDRPPRARPFWALMTGTPARAPVIGVYRRAEGALKVLCWARPDGDPAVAFIEVRK